ncbi:MAG: AraC family transcriptional regulator [Victivallaceae bacterium]
MQQTFRKSESDEFISFQVAATGETSSGLGQLLNHLMVNPVSAVNFICTPEWQVETRTVTDSYWSFIVAGRGKVTLEGDAFTVEPGQLILFPAGVEHAFHPLAGESMEMTNVHFYARVYDVIDLPGLLGMRGAFVDRNGSFALISAAAARSFALRPAGWKLYLEQLIRCLLFELIYDFADNIKMLTPDLKKLTRLYPVISLIERKLADPALNPAALAAEVNISPVYLRMMFCELFGQSPIKFIHRRRIEKACEMLKQTGLTVKEIAPASGFNDIQFFYRIFSRLTGTTPAKYRNQSEF